ncbi:MAG TPA: DUF2147 domain-containing protein [Alphaproteobacteria bacterium]|nr:DUF2147 domain-containing protein [Alphaproteobacteria bacterium]
MKRLLGMLIASVCWPTAALAADQAPSAVGDWVTADHEAVVEIAPCSSGLCGTLVGLRHDHPPGEIPRDKKNPDAGKRGTPLCGLLMLGSFKPDSSNPNRWVDGWAYDPDSGNTYSGQFQLDGPNTLKLRGYVGIPLFGRTETWTREGPEPHNRCAAAGG